ncbi:MAG: hypothetical protein L6Q35_03780 [Phycisphaerales bacterium]|nr:hypothetical protein [Phycisphaerales bacterium]
MSRVAMFAEMAWMERRPELGLLCRAARAHGNRITTAVVQSALPGLPDPGANNVIAWSKMLGLCDARGGLSAMGEEVADTDEAPVPEQGVYGLWHAQHPVLGRRVLAVERLTSTWDQRFESIEPLVVEPDRGRVFRSVLDKKERFMVRDLPTNHGQPGGLVGDTRATCRLRWTLDFDQARDQWQLDGMIEAPLGGGKHAMRPIQHEPESDGLDLWSLAATWATGPLSYFGRWQASERRLAVTFDGLAEGDLDTFRKTLALRRVEIPGKGVYEDVTLEDVSIGPASPQDAQRWAMARFDRHLSAKPGYRSRAEVRDQFAQLTENTPLEAFAPTLPSHGDLLAQANKDPERFWSLAAPVDLSPFPVASDELGALRIGSPAPVAGTEHTGVVRVPYRGGWSMRRLVDRLLAGVIPRRVLLCDRYVRGDDNLSTLKLLVSALRAAAPNVTVDVWTSDEEADFKTIQAITNTSPRSYREVFGRSLPHDRYLLVLPSQGQGFGWHMSNSPLHARADVKGAGSETALRWKDFSATRVSADELEPALRQWLVGGGR